MKPFTKEELEAKEPRWKRRQHDHHTKVAKSFGSYIYTGKIKRECCIICGAKAEAHHSDYTRPLYVTWLCNKHHVRAHMLFGYEFAVGAIDYSKIIKFKTRKNSPKKIEYQGKSYNIKQLSLKLFNSSTILKGRFSRGMSVEEALNTPPRYKTLASPEFQNLLSEVV